MAIDAVDFAFGNARDFADRGNRDSVKTIENAEQQRLDARERQWNGEPECGTPSRIGLKFDRAFQGFDCGFDDVQSDAATRNFSNFIGRA